MPRAKKKAPAKEAKKKARGRATKSRPRQKAHRKAAEPEEELAAGSEGQMEAAGSAQALTLEAEPDAEGKEALAHDTLEGQEQEPRVRIKEIEQELASLDAEQVTTGDSGNGEPLALVRDLGEEISNALAMRGALEADLAAARQELSQQSTIRTELEGRVGLLESRAALASQLRQELDFVDEERNKVFNDFADARAQLEKTTEERDSLAEKVAVLDDQNRRLQADRADVEAELWGLRGRDAETGRYEEEIDRLRTERDALELRAQELAHSSASAESLANALKQNLESLRGTIRDLRAEVKALQEALRTARTELVQVRAEAHDQTEAGKQLQDQLDDLTREHGTATAELEVATETLHDLHRAVQILRERMRGGGA